MDFIHKKIRITDFSSKTVPIQNFIKSNCYKTTPPYAARRESCFWSLYNGICHISCVTEHLHKSKKKIITPHIVSLGACGSAISKSAGPKSAGPLAQRAATSSTSRLLWRFDHLLPVRNYIMIDNDETLPHAMPSDMNVLNNCYSELNSISSLTYNLTS